MAAHQMKCLLSAQCRLSNGPTCNALCSPFIAMHGHSGSGGRAANANVPDDYRLITLGNSPARDATAAGRNAEGEPVSYWIYEVLTQYCATFTRQFDEGSPRIKSLYLYSESPGTGKTTSAAAVLNEWLIVSYIGGVRRNRQPPERPAYFLDVNAWQAEYNAFNRPRVPDSIAEPAAQRYYTAQRLAMTAPFAVLDDVGVRECSEGFRGDLHVIINERVANGLPTVYTSNIPISGLNRLYDARLADRIRDMTVEIAFEGVSKRGMR